MSGTDDRMAAYLAGELPAEEARALEREILGEDAKAEALYGDGNVAAAIDAAAASRRRKVVPLPWWRRTSVRIVLPLAAAALAAIVLLPSREPAPPGNETFRGKGARLLSPVGDVDAVPSRFTWTRDAGAAMYRLELYDLDARLRFRVTTAETTAVLPAEALSGESFETGYWKIVPMNEAGVERPGPPPASIRVREARD
jgi:hypothetical protein